MRPNFGPNHRYLKSTIINGLTDVEPAEIYEPPIECRKIIATIFDPSRNRLQRLRLLWLSTL